jgi:ABC-type phosphate transport system substrate-binding protein
MVDQKVNSGQIESWATSWVGQTAAGNLIQLPMFGAATAIVVNDSGITANGQLQLSDKDLCGVFSGKITKFNQIKDSGAISAAGKFTLIYRSDNALSTFLLTDHLSNVCSQADLKAGVTFIASYSFAVALQFPGGVAAAIPAAVGQIGDDGVANYMAGLSAAGRVARAIGYVAPGWTSLTPNSYTVLSNGKRSALKVAALTIGKNAYLPTVANISLGLSRPQPNTGAILAPPARATDGANPTLWVPLVPTVKSGYPIVGYSMIDLAQCYGDPHVAASLRAFLKAHYESAAYATIQTDNGIAPLSGAAKAFVSAIAKNILSNANGWNTDIEDPTPCAGLFGR